MSADATERFPLRVMVTPAWDTVTVQADAATTVAQLKREALRAALQPTGDADRYQVKFRGAAVLDESLTVYALGAGPDSPLIVLPERRQPVR
jgi:hypothetical protein